MKLRWMLLFMVLCVPGLASAQKSEMTVTVGDAVIGKVISEKRADGSIKSEFNGKVGSVSLSNSIEATFADGALTGYRFVSDQAGQKLTIDLKGLEGIADVSGKKTPFVLKSAPKVLSSNYHPVFFESVFKAYQKNGPAEQEMDCYLMENGVSLNVKVKAEPPVRLETAAGVKVAEMLELSLGQVKLIMARDSMTGDILGVDVPSQSFRILRDDAVGLFVDPSTLYKELSQPTMAIRTESKVPMKLRDGTQLMAEIVRPNAEGKYPVILSRTPYGRVEDLIGNKASWWAKRGYVFVAQDVRGRGESDGKWDPMMHERKDGFDTIQWIADQPWCDGNVGMIGGSYGGIVQWQAAVEKPKALKAIIPQVSPPDAMWNLPYDHGTFMLFGALWWSNIVKDKKADLAGIADFKPDPKGWLTLPLSKVDDVVFGKSIPFYDAWLERDRVSKWKGWNYQSDMGRVKIPSLMISGIWDGDGIGTKMNWEIMRKHGAKNHWLIFGPWPHGFNASTKYADMDYGPQSVIDLNSVYLRYFDTYLKGKLVDWDKQSKVRFFVTGINEWREFSDWPAPDSLIKTLFLSAEKPANSADSQGELMDVAPAQQEPSRYTYDPADTKGFEKGLLQAEEYATTILKPEEMVGDELIYRSKPVEENVVITGPVSLDLYFSSSAKDADFFFSFVDVDPKGQMRLLGIPGKIRASYLQNADKPAPITPNRIYQAKLDHWEFAHQFAKGHRIGIVITSGIFPAFARNLGTGEPIATATRMVVAEQSIYHDSKHPSAVRFRVLPR